MLWVSESPIFVIEINETNPRFKILSADLASVDSKNIFFCEQPEDLSRTLWIFSFLFFPTPSVVGQMLVPVLLLSGRSREWAEPSLPCPARAEDSYPLSEL